MVTTALYTVYALESRPYDARRHLSDLLLLFPPHSYSPTPGVATADANRQAPRAGSRHGRSTRPPSQVSVTATAWLAAAVRGLGLRQGQA